MKPDRAGLDSLPPAPAAPRTAGTGFTLGTAVGLLLVVGALYFGRDIFLPVALALLFSFMLAPAVAWLRRLWLPHTAAVLLVAAVAFTGIGALSLFVGGQVIQLGRDLPNYQHTIKDKMRSLRGVFGGTVFDETTAVLKAVTDELSEAAHPAGSVREGGPEVQSPPLTVRIEPPAVEPLSAIGATVGPLLRPAAMAGAVIVFVLFFLLKRNDLRDRIIRLAGADLHQTTRLLGEAGTRVSRYLMMQLVVNACYGAPIGIGLYLIGVPGAFVWGMLATLLRFVPYLGVAIASLFPLVLAFAVDPGWNMLFQTAILLAVMELITNNILEPWLYGTSTGLSPVAIVLSSIFWTFIWGPIGLFVATPLTVCLVVIGRYIPRLEFFGVLLGNEPVLRPEERLYQRLLAGDVADAIEIAEVSVAQSGVGDFYEHVALPALRLAANQRAHPTGADAVERVALGAHRMVVEVRTQHERRAHDAGPVSTREVGTPVLCIAGQTALDGVAADMLAHLLDQRGISTRQLGAASVSPATINTLDLAGVELVCLCFMGAAPVTSARFIARRLKRAQPTLRVVVGAYNTSDDAEGAEQLAVAVGADATAASFGATVALIDDTLGPSAPVAMVAPPMPSNEAARAAALRASGLLDLRVREQLDRVARRIADAFDAPIAMVSLIDEKTQFFTGAVGLPADIDAAREVPREVSICGHMLASDGPMVIEDLARDARFAGNPLLSQRGIRFYAGAPMRTAAGYAVGSICVLDVRPRTVHARDLKLLQVIADELVVDLERQAAEAMPMPT